MKPCQASPQRPSRLLPVLLVALLAPSVQAQGPWHFGPTVEVAAGKGIFHHLDASGRQALAVSGGQVALAWEDDRNGAPRCFLALKAQDQSRFSEQSFGRGECFAPGIAALGDGRFGVIWEDEAGVAAALLRDGVLGPALRLADRGGQGALAWHPALGLMAAWSAPEGRWQRLWVGRLSPEGGSLRLAGRQALDPAPLKDDQMYPALAATATGFALAWEDRRLGHTVIFLSRSNDGQAWSAPARVSQNATGKAQGTDLGRGTGAMRPALAALGGDKVAVVWLDKRDFLSGYDVYAALPDSTRNTKVQDSFGDAIAQWHPAAAGSTRGELVVAWDDDRDGTPDIWLSRLLPDGGFTDNVAPPPAAGPGGQTDPLLALDVDGSLHLAWVERDADGRSSLRYDLGRPVSW
ncbi:MAG TPA: hypothetical protein PKH69_12040 [Thiobacillaceae bacterium]|nr:hypothetical protein [Thiobacillaceae bacterium]HNU65241.1 hypothetical protein [Thiobacillaceae bacterium]